MNVGHRVGLCRPRRARGTDSGVVTPVVQGCTYAHTRAPVHTANVARQRPKHRHVDAHGWKTQHRIQKNKIKIKNKFLGGGG